MFNLGRANQFFMLIMNQPGGPAASFMVLREQVHVLAWASVVIYAGEAQPQGEPLLGACISWEESVCMPVSVNARVRVFMYRYVFVYVYLHAFWNVGPCAYVCKYVYM